MAGPTGLDKVVLEVPLKSGLIEKIAPEISPPEGMYRLENVELTKIGSYQRRRGFRGITTAGLGPNAPGLIGVPRKIAGRDQEVFIISDDRAYLGSGGGSGNAGLIVWSYSPEQNAWRPHGKVPGTTLERAFGIVNGQPLPKWQGCAFIREGLSATQDKRHVLMAYANNSWGMQSVGIHALVWDVVSRTTILEDTLIDTAATGVKLEVHQSGPIALILYREDTISTPSTANFRGVTYDCTQASLAFFAVFDLFTSSGEGARGWSAVVDSGFVFLVTISISGQVVVRKYLIQNGGGPLVLQGAPVTIHTTDGAACHPGISVAGARVHISYSSSTSNRPRYAAVDTSNLGAMTGPVDVSTTPVSSLGHVPNVGTSSTEACVMWENTHSPINTRPIYWRWMKDGTTTPVGRLNTHRSPGQVFLSHPFVRNSRVFVGVTGAVAGGADAPTDNDAVGGNFGHLLMEIPSDTTQEDSATGNPFITMMPIALWSRDVSNNQRGITRIANASSTEDSEFYLPSARESRKTDEIFRDSAQQLFPVPHQSSVWNIDVMELHFTDRWRWQHAEIDRQTVLACSLPYVYDGDRSHECGFVFRPSIFAVTQVDASAGTAWAVGDTVIYRQVYEWEDFAGRRWFSDPSYPWAEVIEGTTANPLLAKQVSVDSSRPPWVSMKPDGANNFTGRIKVNTYRATSAAPTQFVLINTQTHMIWEASGLRGLDFIGAFTDSGSPILETESLYTFGGELENYVAPSCVALMQHRDRLFAIDLEDNSLRYTKPFNKGRGIEWCRSQAMALPQRGMALASVEGSLLVFTEKSILTLSGPGPSATGIPPDAFSRFAILSQDHGCMEKNAAWRTPRGVVFRSRQGLWMVTPQEAVIYIGAPVEEYMRTVERIVDGALDERLGCLRLLLVRRTDTDLGVESTAFDTLVYWYDSDRWSVDHTHDTFAGTKRSSLFHLGELYHACDFAVFKRADDQWQDGRENVEDGDEVYRALMQTGWYRFDAQSGFRRVWRVLATVKTDAVTQGWGIKVTVETDDRSTEFSFDPMVFAEGEETFDGTLRAHLKFQKGQRYRVTVEEEQRSDLEAYNSGFAFTGLGFELGRKRGAAKLGPGRSTPTVTVP